MQATAEVLQAVKDRLATEAEAAATHALHSQIVQTDSHTEATVDGELMSRTVLVTCIYTRLSFLI